MKAGITTMSKTALANLMFIVGDALRSGGRVVGGKGKSAEGIADLLDRGNQMVSSAKTDSQYGRSIRGRADKFIMQFPIVVSNSVSADLVQTVRNQIELERAYDLKLTIDNSPMMTYDPSRRDFLHQLHNNISIAESVEELPKTTDEVEDKPYASSPKSDVITMNEEAMITNEDKFNLSNLNEMTLPKSYLMSLQEDDKKKEEESTTENKVREDKFATSGNARIEIGYMKDLNSSIPITLTTKINFTLIKHETDDKGRVISSKTSDTIVTKETTFGVKGVVHLVEQDDVEYFLSDSGKNSNFFANLVKYTVGEESFFRKLFRTDRAKKEAQSSRKTGKNIWRNLIMLGNSENIRRIASKGKVIDGRLPLLPTTTLVISKQDEERVYGKVGQRISESKNLASRIYRDLFLLEIWVVDEVNGLVTRYADEVGFDTLKISTLSGGRFKDSQKKDVNMENLERILGRR